MKQKKMNDKPGIETVKQKQIRALVTPRKRDCCGYHEIGITPEDGEYVPLRSGMKITIEALLDKG